MRLSPCVPPISRNRIVKKGCIMKMPRRTFIAATVGAL